MASPGQAEAPGGAVAASDQENADPGRGDTLRKLWQQGAEAIATHRTDNLFQSLEERTLTDEEQRIIEQRVALQRKMFDEYEKRERARKVAELQEVCPDISVEEAEKALEMCDGREDDAAAQLVSGSAFKKRVQSSCGAIPAPALATLHGFDPPPRRQTSRHAKPTGPRPKLIDPSTLDGNVFVGAFRGKGFKPPPKQRAHVKKPAAHARPQHQQNGDSTEDADSDEQLCSEVVQGALSQYSEEQHEVQQLQQPRAGEAERQRRAMSTGEVASEEDQRCVSQHYVLVQNDTLQVPTDSVLRAARRQLGEVSDSRTAGGPSNVDQPTPSSAACSRPLAPVLEYPADERARAAGSIVVPSAGSGQLDGDGGRQLAGPMAPQNASSTQPAAHARRAAKRAALLALSEDETIDLDDCSSDAERSDDSDAVPSLSFRGHRAAAEETKPRAPRPTRAAKQAAAAAFVAYGEDSGDDGSELAQASSDGEAGRHSRQPAVASKRRGSMRKLAGSPSAAAQEPEAANKRQKLEAAIVACVDVGCPTELRASVPGQDGRDISTQIDNPSCVLHPAAEGNDVIELPASAAPRVRAISSTGHTCRGRVKQKSHKSADLVEAGALRIDKGWHNAGYIFPEGFQSRTLFRSSVAIDQLCVHECHIIGKGGQFWPQPTFKVVALDRPDEPLVAKSCTGCWTGILKRINAEIEARRKAGEDLPPPPKTAIAGPEYFGLNQPNIQVAVEALDPDQLCTEYWSGKRDRLRAAAGLPLAASTAARGPRAPRAPPGGSKRPGGGTGSSKGRGRRRGGSDSDSEGHAEGEEDELQFMTNKWSAVTRAERYRTRLQENGEDTSAIDVDNPLPQFIDPITMSAVVRPAISPHGYVAGLATWKVVLSDKQQCPFTNQPLQFEQLKVLTTTNIHLHRDKIVNGHAGAC